MIIWAESVAVGRRWGLGAPMGQTLRSPERAQSSATR